MSVPFWMTRQRPRRLASSRQDTQEPVIIHLLLQQAVRCAAAVHEVFELYFILSLA